MPHRIRPPNILGEHLGGSREPPDGQGKWPPRPNISASAANRLQFWQSRLQLVLDAIRDLCPKHPEHIGASDWAMLMRLTRQTPVTERAAHELFFPSGYRETKGGHPDGFLIGLEPAEYRAAYDAVL